MMKNILQLFNKMQPKLYYGGEGVAVNKACEDKKWREEEDIAYTSNTGFPLYGCTVDETTDCRNIYSTSKSDMPIQGIGLPRIEK